jgi:phosphatidylglycerol:prolipoprotein diacylglycerol transferase
VSGPFVHSIDPIIGEVGGLYLWFYGLSYALGFLCLLLWLRRSRAGLGLGLGEVYELTIMVAAGILLGGRAVEVLFYEWPYYSRHPWQIPAYWLGGMSTHGILLGAVSGAWLFCKLRRRSFLAIADELVIPGAIIMGAGRLGNFVDGQIVGSLTSVPWAVQFPDAAGFRHPVVLYDGLKNLLLVPLLLGIRRARPATGTVMANFIFWYGFLRIFVDLFREYPTSLLGLATGQAFNLFMSLLGISLLVCLRRRRAAEQPRARPEVAHARPATPRLWVARGVFAFLLCFSLLLPSDWTQDVPARYGKRHPGLHHSPIYPPIAPPAARDGAPQSP